MKKNDTQILIPIVKIKLFICLAAVKIIFDFFKLFLVAWQFSAREKENERIW